MVEVSICGRGELQRAEADVIEGLIINAVGLIRVLNQLMHRQGGVVRLHHCIRHLEGKYNQISEVIIKDNYCKLHLENVLISFYEPLVTVQH